MTKINKLTKDILSAIRESIGTDPQPLHAPSFSLTEINYLSECIESTYVSSVGSFVGKFERMLADYTGAKYAIATVNGTAALHVALKIVGVSKNDEVLIPALTFIATANAVSYCNAIPHFVEAESESMGIDVKKLRSYLHNISEIKNGECINRITNRRIKAIVPMHTFGHPSNLDDLLKLCDEFQIVLVEDAAESLGSLYKDRHTGTFGAVGTLSFNGNKILTTGGGGAILTNSLELATQARHLTTTGKLPHKWEFNHDVVGFNYRMPNLNAALGCAQMEKITNFIELKRDLFCRYNESFSNIKGVALIREPKECRSNYWLQTLVLDQEYAHLRDEILRETNNVGLMTRPAWSILSNSIPYAGSPKMDLVFTKTLASRIINIPSSPNLMSASI
jgi:aminotransferase in exopolysaccharide biosynthesis